MPGTRLIHYGGETFFSTLCGLHDSRVEEHITRYERDRITCPDCLEALQAQEVIDHVKQSVTVSGADLDALMQVAFGLIRMPNEGDAAFRARAKALLR